MPKEQIAEMMEAGLSRRTAQAADIGGFTLEDLLDPAEVTRQEFLALPRAGKVSWLEVESLRHARSPEGIREKRILMLLDAIGTANEILDALRAADPGLMLDVVNRDGRLIPVQKV